MMEVETVNAVNTQSSLDLDQPMGTVQDKLNNALRSPDNSQESTQNSDLDLLEGLQKIVDENKIIIENSEKQENVTIPKENGTVSHAENIDDDGDSLLKQLEEEIDKEDVNDESILAASKDIENFPEDELLSEMPTSQPPTDDDIADMLNDSFKTLDEVDGSDAEFIDAELNKEIEEELKSSKETSEPSEVPDQIDSSTNLSKEDTSKTNEISEDNDITIVLDEDPIVQKETEAVASTVNLKDEIPAVQSESVTSSEQVNPDLNEHPKQQMDEKSEQQINDKLDEIINNQFDDLIQDKTGEKSVDLRIDENSCDSLKRKRERDVDENEPPIKRVDSTDKEPELMVIDDTPDESPAKREASVTPDIDLMLELNDENLNDGPKDENSQEEQSDNKIEDDNNLLVDNNNKRRDSTENQTKSDSDAESTASKRPMSPSSSNEDTKKKVKEDDTMQSLDSLAELMKKISEATSKIDEVTSKIDEKETLEKEPEEEPKLLTAPIQFSEIELNPAPMAPSIPETKQSQISLQFLSTFGRPFSTMTRKDLENFVLQKVIEALAYKSEIADLRQKVEKGESTILSLRTKCNDLNKQMRDLEMVHNRVMSDLEKQVKSQVTPVKITRAVGLQVSQPKTMEPRPRISQVPQQLPVHRPNVVSVQAPPLTRQLPGNAAQQPQIQQQIQQQQQRQTMFVQRSPNGKVQVFQRSPQNPQVIQRSPQNQQQIVQRVNQPPPQQQQQYTVVSSNQLSQQQRHQLIQQQQQQAVMNKKKMTVKYTPMRPPMSNQEQMRLEQQQKMEQANRLAMQQKRAAMQRIQTTPPNQAQQIQMLAQMQQQQQQQQQQIQNQAVQNASAAQQMKRMNLTRTLSNQAINTPQTAQIRIQPKPQPTVLTTTIGTQPPQLIQTPPNRQLVVRKVNGVLTATNQNVQRAIVNIPPNIVTAPPAATIVQAKPVQTPPLLSQPIQIQRQPAPVSASSSFCVDLTDEEDGGQKPKPAPAGAPKSIIQIRTPANLNQNYNQVLAAQRSTASPTTAASGANTPPLVKTSSPTSRTVATKSTSAPSVKRPIIGPKSVMQQRQSGHPAPLPPFVPQVINPAWKKMPPKPSIRINNIETGIVISWTMNETQLTDEYASITSYQIYAYQETAAAPSTDMWRHVGDVKAMPLPMAVTLTQFQEGERYYFAVRALDEHNRFGPFSAPKIWDDPK